MLKKWFSAIINKFFKNRYLAQNNDARCVYNDACLKYRLGKFEEIVNMQISDNDDLRLIVFFYDLLAAAKYRLKNKDNPVFKDIKNKTNDFSVLIKNKKYYDAFNMYTKTKLSNLSDVKKDCAISFFKALQSALHEYEYTELVDMLKEINDAAKSVLRYDELTLLIEFWAFQCGITSPKETIDFLFAAQKDSKDCLLVYPLIIYLYWMGLLCADEMQKHLSDAIEEGVNYAYFMRSIAHIAYTGDRFDAQEDFENFKLHFDDVEEYNAIPIVELQQLGYFPT